jgi:formylglycine-generating enzyme required for sulfatase activity
MGATGDMPPTANIANYASSGDWNGMNGNLTTVGSAGPGSASYYGTYDQNGNVSEWDESIVNTGVVDRVIRGGNWFQNATYLQSSYHTWNSPSLTSDILGFRIAYIPEPGMGALFLAGMGMVALRRRKRAS